MAKIARVLQKIFALSASDIGDFGSAAAGSPVSGTNPGAAAIQSLSQYSDGWLAATLGATKFPAVEDMNALDQLFSTQLAYIFQEGVAEYDASTTYYHYSVVKNPGSYQLYGSKTDNNTGNALSDTVNWEPLVDLANSGFTTGDEKTTWKTTADTGWILANDGSIGSAASGATTRANADTLALYTLWWNNVSDTYAPVATGRGANAAADFAANKAMTMPLQKGRVGGVYGTGAGLTARTLGQTFGEEGHALTSGENGTHTHTATPTDPGHTHTFQFTDMGGDSTNGPYVDQSAGGVTASNTFTTASGSTGITVSNANSGSGTAHNTMQPTVFKNIMIKL